MSAEAKAEPYVVPGNNRDQPWDEFESDPYINRNYQVRSPHDLYIAQRIIRRVRKKLPEAFAKYASLTEIGTCGTLRTSALLAPLLAPNATVTLTDVAEPQLNATRHAVERARQGDLGIWESHEAAMAEVDPAWRGAVARIGAAAVVCPQNLYELEPDSTEIAVEGHTLCSNTRNPKEYKVGRAAFYGSVRPGGLAFRLSMVGSTGYQASPDGPHFASYPVDLDAEVSDAEKMGLRTLAVVYVPRLSDLGHFDVRSPNDPTTYKGYGALLFQRPE